jgi:hypothetical protein
MTDTYLSPYEASQFLRTIGLPTAATTLAKLRCVGGGPRFSKFGRKPVYTRQSLEDFARAKLSREVASTSELVVTA